MASKTIKKAEKLYNTKPSKLVSADLSPSLVAIATQETSNHVSVVKTEICQDVKMLLSLKKYTPSVMYSRKSLTGIKRNKKIVKKPENI
jgi:hypothetical protein